MRDANALVNYESARRALALAAKVDEVLNIRDQAKVIEAYSKIAKDRELEANAFEIRVRAERRLGELLVNHKETVGFADPGRPKKSVPDRNQLSDEKNGSGSEPIKPTLSDMGVDKKISSRAQKLAAIPEQEFEEHIDDHKQRIAANNARTVNKLERAGNKAIERKKQEDCDTMMREVEVLRDQVNELSDNLAEAIADNESMAKVFESDDNLKAALDESKRLRDVNRILEQRINGLMAEKTEAVREARRFKLKFEKAEKRIAELTG